MAADNEIRVVITGTAADLRAALTDAKGDLGGLSAAIKAVPDKIDIDVRAQIADAASRLTELRTLVDSVPRDINIVASADTGVAQAQLAALRAEIARTEAAAASASLVGAGIGGAGGGGGGAQAPSRRRAGAVASGASLAIRWPAAFSAEQAAARHSGSGPGSPGSRASEPPHHSPASTSGIS